MDKLYFSNADINSIVFTFAQAKANGQRGPAENIFNSLTRLRVRSMLCEVDLEDPHVLHNALETCRLGLDQWDQDLIDARTRMDRERFHNLCLEGAEVFNQLWKLYTRRSSI